MGVDYMIGYGCVPKEVFTSEGILERVKGGERAKRVQDFYAEHGERRRPEDMGFEMTYRTASGEEQTEILNLEDLIKKRAELEPYEHHCTGCPANRIGKPFGCIGSINYPISERAEYWMLSQLPNENEPLPYLLLMQGRDMGNTGESATELRRNNPGVFFESSASLVRRYPEMEVTGEQLFELLFLLGPIQPKRAVMILIFMHTIERNMEAGELMHMTTTPLD
ncbi:MAG TPA: hypothetical protein VJZ27_10535, partial [Aggregatilineales bacterium]|nr:hypothetical protein [Aggregatilineales bacterium]